MDQPDGTYSHSHKGDRMRIIELTDSELALLLELVNKVSISARAARIFIGLQDKIIAAGGKGNAEEKEA